MRPAAGPAEKVMVVVNRVFFCTCIVVTTSAFESPCPVGFVPFPGSSVGTFDCVNEATAFSDSMVYLSTNLPSFDSVNRASLGFPTEDDLSWESSNVGIANVGVNSSLAVRSVFPWAATVPLDLWQEYVLPYANVNEARTNWRPLFLDTSVTLLAAAGSDTDALSTSDVLAIINAGIWSAFGRTIVFKSSQTPLIYDPMSVLSYSCAHLPSQI